MTNILVEKSKLRSLFDKYGCDKGTLRHCYDRVYEHALENYRDKPIRLLEIGVLRGESVQAWLEFFPQGHITVIDIFKRVPAKEVPILRHERVSWCKCDSLKKPNWWFRRMVGDEKFDVIIDDGLHFHDAQRTTFENFIPYLVEGGTYFIEDVWPLTSMTPEAKQHWWLKDHPDAYSDEKYQLLLDAVHRYQTTCHDLRDGHEPDSYVLQIDK